MGPRVCKYQGAPGCRVYVGHSRPEPVCDRCGRYIGSGRAFVRIGGGRAKRDDFGVERVDVGDGRQVFEAERA